MPHRTLYLHRPTEDHLSELEREGMTIPDRDLAGEFMERIGFYRFRCYAYALRNSFGGFDASVLFDDVVLLYEFDKRLRALLVEKMEKIEVAIRSRICLELDSKYGPFWIEDSRTFGASSSKFAHRDFLNEVAKEVGRSKERFLLEFYSSHPSALLPPSWMCSEAMSFGKWLDVYMNLRDNRIKKAISQTFGLQPPNLESYLRSVNVLRNVCAHHSRAWNRRYRVTPLSLPQQGIATGNQLYPLLRILHVFEKHIDGNSDLSSRLQSLISDFPTVDLSKMGFESGWSIKPYWS